MGKLIVSRWIFDEVIAEHVSRQLADDYDFYTQATEQLEIRKIEQKGGEMETLYVDFGGDLKSARDFSDMYSIPRKDVVLVRDLARELPYMDGRRVRLKPVNLDYWWSLLNWNHTLHITARYGIYKFEAMYGSVDA